MSSDLQRAFLEDIAVAVTYWVETVAATVEDPASSNPWMDDPDAFQRLGELLDGRTDDLRVVLGEGMLGLAHSFLNILDGATASAEIERVQVVDSHGRPLADGLHELFVDHMIETGRIA